MPAKKNPTAVAASPPVEEAAHPVVPPTAPKPKKEAKPRVAKEKKVADPVADVEGAAAPVVKRRVAMPISPRTVKNRLSQKGDDCLSYKEVRSTVNDLGKNVGKAMRLAYLIGKNGSATFNGVEYDKTKLNDLSKIMTDGVRQIPQACRLSSHRSGPKLDDAEREERVRLLVEEATTGVKSLAESIKVPKIVVPLVASETARISEKKNPPKPGAGAQIGAPFYISDPLRSFIQHAELGNGLAHFFPDMPEEVRAVSGARDPMAAIKAIQEVSGQDPVKALGVTLEQAKFLADPRNVIAPLVIDRSIATSPILMSIMASYIVANGLKDKETGRIRIDDHMRKYLGGATNTRWCLGKTDFTPEDASDDMNKSGLARLQARPSKHEGGAVPCDGETFERSMSIALASMYRIAKLPEKQTEALAHPAIHNLANGVKAYM